MPRGSQRTSPPLFLLSSSRGSAPIVLIGGLLAAWLLPAVPMALTVIFLRKIITEGAAIRKNAEADLKRLEAGAPTVSE